MSLTYDVLKDDVRAGRPIDFGFVTYVPELTCHAVVTDENPYVCECSECGQPDIDGWNYCPSCGARIVEVSADDRR